MFKYKRLWLITPKTLNAYSKINSQFYMDQQSRLFSAQTNAKEVSPLPIANLEWEKAQPFKEIPSLSKLSVMRDFLPFGKYYKIDPTKLMALLKSDMGQIVRSNALFGRPQQVITQNPHDFEKVYRNEGIWPIRPGFEASLYHRNVIRADFFQGTEGIVASNGEKWANFRSIVNPVLMQPKNVRLYFQKMSDVGKEFIERIRTIRDPLTMEVPETFIDEINRYTLESVSVVALDKQLGLINKNRDNPDVQRLFDLLNEFFESGFEFEPPFWKYYKTKAFKNHMKVLDGFMEISSKYVNEAIKRLEQEASKGLPEKSDSEKSMLEKLIKIDKMIATVMTMDMLVAGVDTTSTTLTGILLCLAKNPEKQTKLRQEILKVLPQKNSEIDEEAFRNMPYLRACIKEALRIYPLAIGNSRILINDTILSGYRVPKGTQVIMVSSTILKDDNHYPRAKEYLPERWLRSSKLAENVPNAESSENSLKASSPFIYLPFGFGPRTCVGRRIVEMELELGIARLLRNYHIEFNYSTENAFRTLMLNVPNIPLKFKFSDVKN